MINLIIADLKLFEVLGKQDNLEAAFVLLARCATADLNLFAQLLRQESLHNVKTSLFIHFLVSAVKV